MDREPRPKNSLAGRSIAARSIAKSSKKVTVNPGAKVRTVVVEVTPEQFTNIREINDAIAKVVVKPGSKVKYITKASTPDSADAVETRDGATVLFKVSPNELPRVDVAVERDKGIREVTAEQIAAAARIKVMADKKSGRKTDKRIVAASLSRTSTNLAT